MIKDWVLVDRGGFCFLYHGEQYEDSDYEWFEISDAVAYGLITQETATRWLNLDPKSEAGADKMGGLVTSVLL